MSQQDPAAPDVSQTGTDPGSGVGEHVSATPSRGDVDHLEGEFGELEPSAEPCAGDPGDPDTSDDEPSERDGA